MEGQPDKLIWHCSADGVFTVKSAYNLYFMTNTIFACAKPIWRSKAPMKCKFFMWLVVHKRCLTADILEKRGWPHNATCTLCNNANESCTHLFVHCRFSHQVWSKVRDWAKADFPIPNDDFLSSEDWWLQARKKGSKSFAEGFRHGGHSSALADLEGTERPHFSAEFLHDWEGR
jgi:hypothetical protein